MTKGDLIGQYKTMSAQDQRTFDRWLSANLVLGSAIAAGLLFMAFGGPDLVTPGAAVADGKPVAESSVPVPGRAMSPFDLMIRIAPDALPTQQVDEPF
jgi:hypothetical protein